LPSPRWIIANRLGRRNLTPEQQDSRLGKTDNREKSQGERTDLTAGQNGQKFTTAEKLAEQDKGDEKTGRRAGQFAEAVETVAAKVGEEVKQKILAGDSTLTKESVIVLAKESPEKQKEVFAQGEAEILKAAKEIKRERG
jgi:hypothetical protein